MQQKKQAYCICVDPSCVIYPKFFCDPKDMIKHTQHSSHIKSFDSIQKDILRQKEESQLQNYDIHFEISFIDYELNKVSETFKHFINAFGQNMKGLITDKYNELQKIKNLFQAVHNWDYQYLSGNHTDFSSLVDHTKLRTEISRIDQHKIKLTNQVSQLVDEIHSMSTNFQKIDKNHHPIKSYVQPTHQHSFNQSNFVYNPDLKSHPQPEQQLNVLELQNMMDRNQEHQVKQKILKELFPKVNEIVGGQKAIKITDILINFQKFNIQELVKMVQNTSFLQEKIQQIDKTQIMKLSYVPKKNNYF